MNDTIADTEQFIKTMGFFTDPSNIALFKQYEHTKILLEVDENSTLRHLIKDFSHGDFMTEDNYENMLELEAILALRIQHGNIPVVEVLKKQIAKLNQLLLGRLDLAIIEELKIVKTPGLTLEWFIIGFIIYNRINSSLVKKVKT